MSSTGEATVRVADAPARGRYEISVGDELAGFTQYRDEGDVRIFPHTEINEAYAGRGLASALIKDALDDTRKLGKAVIPLCPAVRAFIRRHTEYLDLVPEAKRAELGL